MKSAICRRQDEEAKRASEIDILSRLSHVIPLLDEFLANLLIRPVAHAWVDVAHYTRAFDH